MRIMICGSTAVDMVFTLPQFPDRGEKFTATSAAIVGGGCAGNAAVAVARLGAYSQLLARVGADEIGQLTLQDLMDEGVDCALVHRASHGQSAMSSVLIDAHGDRQIVAFRGGNLVQIPDWQGPDLPEFAAALADTRWPQAAARLLETACARAKPGVLDGEAPVPPHLIALASHTAFSMQGLRDLTGQSDPLAGLAQIFPHSGGWVCATDGPNGVYIYDATGASHIPAFAVDAVDTLGAGDVWHGAFTLRLAEAAPASDAVRFANATAALKCTRHGGRRGTPNRQQVEDFLKEQS